MPQPLLNSLARSKFTGNSAGGDAGIRTALQEYVGARVDIRGIVHPGTTRGLLEVLDGGILAAAVGAVYIVLAGSRLIDVEACVGIIVDELILAGRIISNRLIGRGGFEGHLEIGETSGGKRSAGHTEQHRNAENHGNHALHRDFPLSYFD